MGEDPELLSALFRGVAALVATPGRLLNLLDKRKTNLRRLCPPPGISGEDAAIASGVIVLDEADRMLALGFERPLRRILAHILPPKERVVGVPLASAEAPRGPVSRSPPLKRGGRGHLHACIGFHT